MRAGSLWNRSCSNSQRVQARFSTAVGIDSNAPSHSERSCTSSKSRLSEQRCMLRMLLMGFNGNHTKRRSTAPNLIKSPLAERTGWIQPITCDASSP